MLSLIRKLFGDNAERALDTSQIEGQAPPIAPSPPLSEAGTRAMVGQLRRELAEHPSKGLTPATLYEILEGAERGDLQRQHELASDMEEKDPQIQSDLGKRKLAAAELDWEIVAPEGASRIERKATDQASECLSGLEVEDLLIDLGDGILHGWCNLELTWDREGETRVVRQPIHRPHGWFRLHSEDQGRLMLRDGTLNGADLWPLGWVQHIHKAKSGYPARIGLLRTLCWPYLFQNYALGDLAELLELMGIPARLGYYPTSATPEQKATLLRAVTALGHRAAGIIPDGMRIEYLAAANTTHDLYSTMLEWCERSKSKAILGGTLTTGTDQGSGAYALGAVHERGLLSLVNSDCRQYAGSIRRYLLWPMAALNYGITDLRRTPRFVLDTSEPDDYKLLSDALPVFVDLGARIPVSWLHDRTRIPEAEESEPILRRSAPDSGAAIGSPGGGVPAPASGSAGGGVPAPEPAPTPPAALKADLAPPDSAQALIDAEGNRDPGYQGIMERMLAPILAALDEGLTPEEILARLDEWYPMLDDDTLTELLTRGMAAADAIGRLELQDEGAARAH